MKNASLIRQETGDYGTFGNLKTEDGFSCATLELPWRQNQESRSCIPAGMYIFKLRKDSPKHGECYEALPDDEAPGRTAIQIHAANLAGDVGKGYVSQLEGCISLGQNVAQFLAGEKPAGPMNQRGISQSKATVAAFMKHLAGEVLALTISWADGLKPEDQ